MSDPTGVIQPPLLLLLPRSRGSPGDGCRGARDRPSRTKTECPVAFAGITAFTWQEQPARDGC